MQEEWTIDDSHGLTVGPYRIRYGVTAREKNKAFAYAHLVAAAPAMLSLLKALAPYAPEHLQAQVIKTINRAGGYPC